MAIEPGSTAAETPADVEASTPTNGKAFRLPELPFRPATVEEFSRLRALLEASGFLTTTIQERRGGAVIERLTRRAEEGSAIEPDDAAEVLIRLFVDGHAVARADVERLLPGDLAALLDKVGLLQEAPGPAPSLRAPMALYPTAGLLIVSDYWWGSATYVPEEIVYPALTANTVEFLKALPTGPCDTVLDIGSGTGIAALLGARNAREAWATDIAGRSCRVAEFNAKLNGIENLRSVEGDLYAPVAGRTFDRIVSHPPYVPSTELRVIFRDGGEDGEQITRRIIAGLPEHLRPGGRFYCRCMATDRRNAPLEQRVREMLGPQAEQFDVMVVPTVSMQAGSYFSQVLVAGRTTAAQFEQQMHVYDRLEVENIVIGSIVIVRHDAERTPLTVRRQFPKGVDPDAEVIEWLYEWERRSSQPVPPEFHARLLAAKPKLAPGVEIEMLHRAGDGGLHAVRCRVAVRTPFLYSIDGSPSLAVLFERCDGTRSFADLYREAVDGHLIPPATPEDEFLALARTLVGAGVVEIDEHPLPRPPEADPA